MPELTSETIVKAIDEDLIARVQSLNEPPKLAILSDNIEHKPSLAYVTLKQRVARSLGIDATALFANSTTDLIRETRAHSLDDSCHAIIVQLPLAESQHTDEVLGAISPHKDVDGLAHDTEFSPATPLGILTLIEGHAIKYQDARIAIMGKGRLVGAPLLRLMQQRGAENIIAFDETSSTHEVREGLNKADLIISAVGKPGLLTPALFDGFSSDQTFIDAGAAESGGVVVGDISDDLRSEILKHDGRITAQKGSVGPLTVRALLTNVVTAAARQQITR